MIAVQKPDGRFDATPSPDTALEVGDVVIAVGTVAELSSSKSCSPSTASRARDTTPMEQAPADAIRRLEHELSELAHAAVALERPTKDEHGDYATNVALRAAPAAGRPPRELAEELAGRVADLTAIERTEVAGPGFLNLWLKPAMVRRALGEVLEAGADYGAGSATTKERIQVELVSANPTGPLTVGHGRTAPTATPSPACFSSRGTRSSASSTTTTSVVRSTSSGSRLRRVGVGTSRPRAATAAPTWWWRPEGAIPSSS